MDKVEKIILISILTIAPISWILSIEQPDMMAVMMYYNPFTISLFTVSWAIGMAAILFPAVTPMVLLYKQLSQRSNGNRSSGNSDGNSDGNTVGKGTHPSQSSIFFNNGEDDYSRTAEGEKRLQSSLLSIFTASTNIIFFVGGSMVFILASRTIGRFGGSSAVAAVLIGMIVITNILPSNHLMPFLPWYLMILIPAVLADLVLNKYRESEVVAGAIIGSMFYVLGYPMVSMTFVNLLLGPGAPFLAPLFILNITNFLSTLPTVLAITMVPGALMGF